MGESLKNPVATDVQWRKLEPPLGGCYLSDFRKNFSVARSVGMAS